MIQLDCDLYPEYINMHAQTRTMIVYEKLKYGLS